MSTTDTKAIRLYRDWSTIDPNDDADGDEEAMPRLCDCCAGAMIESGHELDFITDLDLTPDGRYEEPCDRCTDSEWFRSVYRKEN